MTKLKLVKEFFNFLKERKKLWLLPMILILWGFAALLIIAKAGGMIAPFVYTLF